MAPPIFPSGAALLVQFILLFGTIVPVHSGNAQNFTLNPASPPPVQCEPFTFSWTGGTPPFFVNLIEQGGPGLRVLGPANDSFFTWSSADFPANTVVQAMVWGSDSESSGLSAAFVVQPGSDNECLIGPPDTSGTSTTSSSTDPTAHVPSVGVSSSSALHSAPPGSPSASRPRLSTGAAAGITAATSAVATSLGLASFLYIKRRRRRRAPAATGADLSLARRGSRNSSSHGDTCTASSSDADRTHNGDRSKSDETDEDPEARTRANSSLVARASSMDTGAPDCAGDLVSHQAHRESVNGVVEAEKLLREMRSLNRNVNVNGPGGGRNGNGQTETDAAAVIQEHRAAALEVEHHRRHETEGGVRLGGGRAGEVRADDSDVDQLSTSESVGSTLPPPYSSDFGED